MAGGHGTGGGKKSARRNPITSNDNPSVNTQLEKLVYNNADAKLEVVLDEHNRVIETLKNQIFDIRMLPLSTVFNRFKRAVIELGKETKLFFDLSQTSLFDAKSEERI